MAFPPQHFQHQQPQSNPSRNFFTMDTRIQPHMQFYDFSNLQDQSPQNPPTRNFDVVGFAPETADGNDVRVDLELFNGVQIERNRPEEFDFFKSNSQVSPIDLFRGHPVSTSLGLLLDHTGVPASSQDSPLLSLLGDGIDSELRQHDAEIDKFIKIQGQRLRQAIAEKVQASNLQMVSPVEQKVVQKLQEKEAEAESINKRNMDLEERIEQLTAQAAAWQECATVNENMSNILKLNLQQAYAQTRDRKEGCGVSDVDDTASSCSRRGVDLQLVSEVNNNMRELMACKVCKTNRVCMLMLPCRHLCLCNECESKLSYCPLCMSPKFTVMKVYM